MHSASTRSEFKQICSVCLLSVVFLSLVMENIGLVRLIFICNAIGQSITLIRRDDVSPHVDGFPAGFFLARALHCRVSTALLSGVSSCVR